MIDLDALEALASSTGGPYFDVWEDGSSHKREGGAPFVLVQKLDLLALIQRIREADHTIGLLDKLLTGRPPA